MNPGPQTMYEVRATEHRRGVKCCPSHIGPSGNRAARRVADRSCSCRGECGFHTAPARPVRAE